MTTFEIGKRYTLVAPQGVITPAGIQAIINFIQGQRLQTDESWKTANPTNERHFLPNLPDMWQWVWLVTGRGDYVGTFPKRISKYYHKEFGIKCPEKFLAEIGNVARQHTEDNLTYSFDFTDRLNWNAGDFGDSGSCYWGSNWDARDTLEAHGGMAIRFYESADSDKGIARAWLMNIGEALYIIFNGYGFSTLVIARAFSMFLNLSYKKILLSNYDNTSGLIYINNDSGYIIGSADEIASYTEYDFEIETNENHCMHCGDRLNEDDTYFAPDTGYAYCQYCFYDRYERCDRCYDDFARDDMYYVESTGESVCERCLDRHFSYCESCNEYYEPDQMHERNEEWYCQACFDHLPPDEPNETDESEETDNEE
jgi:hypothetical protein